MKKRKKFPVLKLEKKYVVKSKDDESEFVIEYATDEDLNDHYTMYRSMSPAWTCPGERVLYVIDDGNKLEVLFPAHPIREQNDYGAWGQLFLLMNVMHQMHPIFEGYVISEEKQVINL